MDAAAATAMARALHAELAAVKALPTTRAAQRAAEIWAEIDLIMERAAKTETARVEALAGRPLLPREKQFMGLPPGEKVSRKSLYADKGATIPPKEEQTRLRIKEANVRRVNTVTSQIVDLLTNSDGTDRSDVLAFSGALARTTKGLVDQTKVLLRTAGVDFRPEQTDVDRYKDILDEVLSPALDSAVLRSAIVNLAFSAAAASGQDSKSVSDRDIKRFIVEIGENTGSATIFKGVLRSFALRQEEGFQLDFQAQTGIRKSNLGTPTQRIEDMSPDELDSLILPLLTPEQRSKVAVAISGVLGY